MPRASTLHCRWWLVRRRRTWATLPWARESRSARQEKGFGLAVALEVVVPALPHDEAQQLADQAHQVCPYSSATRGNIRVDVTVVDD